jgi:hypothetical protein
MLRIALLMLVAALAALSREPPALSAEEPGLTVLLATDVPEYAAGALVTFTVAVDNRSDAPITLVFPSAQVFDITVVAQQREVWRWSADRDFAQAETERGFPPGVTLVDRTTWQWRTPSGAPLPPGTYRIQASLATAPRQPGNVLLVALLGE